jgi:hypothetical protein
MGVRVLPARLRRKASSEPAGCEPVEQGAIPWRRPICAQVANPHPRIRDARNSRASASRRRRAGWRRHRSDTAGPRGSIPRSSTSRTPPGPRPGPLLAVGERLTRRFWEPEIAGSTPAGQIAAVRAFDATRGRGEAVLASVMSSRPWVRIPPALSMRTLSTGRALRAVTAAPQAVVVRFHPSALRETYAKSPRPGREAAGFRDFRATGNPRERIPVLRNVRGRALGEHLSLAPRRGGFDSRRLHPASVVSTASTRPLYGRGVGSTPAGGSLSNARSSVDLEHCLATAEVAGSNPAGRTSGGRSSDGKAPERHSGEARSIRAVRSHLQRPVV